MLDRIVSDRVVSGPGLFASESPPGKRDGQAEWGDGLVWANPHCTTRWKVGRNQPATRFCSQFMIAPKRVDRHMGFGPIVWLEPIAQAD